MEQLTGRGLGHRLRHLRPRVRRRTRSACTTSCAARCPVAHTERWGGQWMPVNYADLVAVTSDTDHLLVGEPGGDGPPPGEGPVLSAPPITSDPPEHGEARRLLLPSFAPRVVERLTPLTEDIARQLIDEIRASGDEVVDVADRYARHIPVRVIATMLGVPLEDEDQFTDWAVRILQIGPARRRRAARGHQGAARVLPGSRRGPPGRSGAARRPHRRPHERPRSTVSP